MPNDSLERSRGWLQAVAPIVMLLALAADGWLLPGRAAVANNADVELILVAVIAGAGYLAGLASALVGASVLAGTSFYAEILHSASDHLNATHWIHFAAVLVGAFGVALAAGRKRDRGSNFLEPERTDHSIQRVDVVTGLPNRRVCLQMARVEWDRWRRFASPFSILLVAVDDFEAIRREERGQVDSILRVLANQLTSVLRSMDLAGRFDEGEFLVLLPHTNLSGSRVVSEKLLNRVRQLKLEGQRGEFSLSLSIGCAAVTNRDDDLRNTLQRATEARRHAQESGGNQILCDEISSGQGMPVG